MEYYGNALCVTVDEIVESGAISYENYKKLSSRGKLSVVRRGGGSRGQKALIAFDSLPPQARAAVISLYPHGREERLVKWVEKNYEWDAAALAYYSREDLPCGVLSPAKRREYTINASVLNCCIRLHGTASDTQRLFGSRFSWDRMSGVLEILRESFGHTLPGSTQRLQRKCAEYQRTGYASLLSGKFGNQSSRKIDGRIARLLLSLACQPEKPYARTVWEQYCQWRSGRLDVYDAATGELFALLGHPAPELSERSVSDYLSRADVRALVAKAHLSPTAFMHEVMPHMHRHAPQWSLSKVSLDDRDLPRKLKDTKSRVKAYYAYDVLSQCVVGYAHSRQKTQELVVACFRSLFRLIDRMGWGCPAQLEVENHLMSQWRDSFLRSGEVFPLVRFCAPQNSQEKYAEVLNRSKKVSVEHRRHEGIGRFYARLPQNRVESQKQSDATNGGEVLLHLRRTRSRRHRRHRGLQPLPASRPEALPRQNPLGRACGEHESLASPDGPRRLGHVPRRQGAHLRAPQQLLPRAGRGLVAEPPRGAWRAGPRRHEGGRIRDARHRRRRARRMDLSGRPPDRQTRACRHLQYRRL